MSRVYLTVSHEALVVSVELPLPVGVDAIGRAVTSQSDAAWMTLDFSANKATVGIVVADRGAVSLEGNIAAAIDAARVAWLDAIKSETRTQPE